MIHLITKPGMVFRTPNTLVIVLGLSRVTLTHLNMAKALFEKRMVEDDKPVVPGCLWSYPWYEKATELLSVVRGKSYLWNLKMLDPTPRELARRILWLLLATVAKVRGGKYSLGDAFGFSFLLQAGGERVQTFPKVNFEWAKMLKSLCAFCSSGKG